MASKNMNMAESELVHFGLSTTTRALLENTHMPWRRPVFSGRHSQKEKVDICVGCERKHAESGRNMNSYHHTKILEILNDVKKAMSTTSKIWGCGGEFNSVIAGARFTILYLLVPWCAALHQLQA